EIFPHAVAIRNQICNILPGIPGISFSFSCLFVDLNGFQRQFGKPMLEFAGNSNFGIYFALPECDLPHITFAFPWQVYRFAECDCQLLTRRRADGMVRRMPNHAICASSGEELA